MIIVSDSNKIRPEVGFIFSIVALLLSRFVCVEEGEDATQSAGEERERKKIASHNLVLSRIPILQPFSRIIWNSYQLKFHYRNNGKHFNCLSLCINNVSVTDMLCIPDSIMARIVATVTLLPMVTSAHGSRFMTLLLTLTVSMELCQKLRDWGSLLGTLSATL